MIELFSICTNDSFSYMIISINFLIWTFLMISVVVVTVLVFVLLYKFSKNPENWAKKPSEDIDIKPGMMKDLSSSIKSDKKLNEYSSSIRNALMMMFFQKVEAVKDISTNEMVDIKNNNSSQLYTIIQDADIVNWILNLDDNSKTKKINKQNYLNEINLVLEKMEAWGE